MASSANVSQPRTDAHVVLAFPGIQFRRRLPADLYDRRGLVYVERTIALLLLLALSPLLLALLCVTWILSRRSPLVAHRRVGRYGRQFWMLKLRTMWGSSAPETAWRFVTFLGTTPVPMPKPRFDPRVVSRFAAFCRRYSLDELPQLWHVAEGKMSLVGPRPLTSSELDEHYGPAAAEVLSVPPGITGLWQVRGRNRLTYPQRLRLDLLFVRKQSLGLYLATLARTPGRVFSGKDSG